MIWKLLFPLSVLTIGALCAPRSALLGAKECTWGPSYWCKNLTSAHGCRAVPHCISTWERLTVEDDPDDICVICKHMVIEARDQLESNMTMDELKQVFEGSCKLMYIKPAVKICDKLADELVPELVDTISSQMNPDVVCSVAGLCNNADIDNEIEKYRKESRENSLFKKRPLESDYSKQNCDLCGVFVNRTVKNVKKLESSELLSYLLDLCGKTSSFSDSCASLVLMNYEAIEKYLRQEFSGAEVCTLSGSCVSNRKPLEGDETCELCQQLIQHFKDIVTADTTEAEFQKVLRGVCKQTGKFSEECLQLVNQYSNELFKIIANDMDGKQICGFFNVCPSPGVYVNGPIAPLLPEPPVPVLKGKVKVSEDNVKVRVMVDETPKPTISYGDTIALQPLPENLLLSKPEQSLLGDTNVNDQQGCVFCQYLLHYIQKVITQPYGEDAIKKVIDDVCDKLPNSVTLQCRNFVNLYGDAFVALLAQEIDPSQVCPSIKICPAKVLSDSYEPIALTGKPGCALCLMAMSALDEELTSNKTEQSIKVALDKVCLKLPKSLVEQCDNLVKEYTTQLVEMIMADFTPEEVCAYLKICKKPGEVEVITTTTTEIEVEEPYEIRTNEVELPLEEMTKVIDDGAEKEVKGTPTCVICEFVMEKVDDLIKENKTQVDMDKVIHSVCNHLPHTVRENCNTFVVKYAKEIVNTLAMFVAPSEVCTYMGMCMKTTWRSVELFVAECTMCQQIADLQRMVMKGQDVHVDRTNFLMGVCAGVEDNQGDQCRRYIRRHGVPMFNAFMQGVSADNVCEQLSICSKAQTAKIVMASGTEREPELLGAKECTHGPGFWCKSRANALQCGAGAVKHCQDNVWPF